jgi:colanic acid biosynthesis glycosyl transferase WcaI
MRILVLGNNYAPERTGIAPFTTGLCEDLAARGHKVTAITARPSYPEWRVWDGYRNFMYRKESLNGVEVRRIWHFLPRRPSGLVQRLCHDLSFTLGGFMAGLVAGEFDVIYCCCPPPTLGLAAYVLGKIRRKPYIMKLADLASDAALATGILTDGWLVRIARGLESLVYRKAQKVVCLCQGFMDKLVSRGVPSEKLHLIPDWADLQRVYPIDNATSFRRENNLSLEQFLVLHSGNMGKKQDLLNVVRAAELCRSIPEIVWLLVGDGEDRALIAEEIGRQNLENIRLLPLQPAESLAEMYSAADVLLLNQKATVQDAVIPSKLLTYMAAGRAVIAAVSERSESARLVQAARCGLIVPAEDPDAFVRTVMDLRESPELREEFGKNGRAYADRNFTKEKVLDEYEIIFNAFTGKQESNAKVPKEAAAVD